VLFTPNAASLSHQLFKQDWRGLEPPRHLHVFSTQSLPLVLKRAGFREVTVRPQVARSVVYESLLLRWHGASPATGGRRNRRAGLLASLTNLVELAITPWKPSVADCVAAIAVKQ
jgi:hypothetical protein